MRRGLAGLLAALLTAATQATVSAAEEAAPAWVRACPLPAALPAQPADALNVQAFGARGDGQSDDTAALQRALAALVPGQWLHFPAGTYVHSRRLSITTADATLDGRGATLHATNPDDQALLIQADGVRVFGFTLTAVTDVRRHAPWQSRIAVWRHGEGLRPLRGIEIRGNRIVESGAPGSPHANSSSSAAIFVHNAAHFLVEGNLVRRSLADAIHVTGGSRHGRVLGNTVREVGDDMVAVVSYLGSESASTVPFSPAAWAALREQRLVRDILIADNDLSGQYWGRGVSVVGGEDVSIVANRVDATSHAAGIYLARESSYRTFGVRNVRVLGNRVTRVQSQRPAYTVLAWPRSERRTGHAGVEVIAQLDATAARDPLLREALRVRDVAVEDNVLDDVATSGVRIGTEGVATVAQADRLMLVRNRMQRIEGGDGLRLRGPGASSLTLHCQGNVLDGSPLKMPACSAPSWPITGAAQGCARAAGP